MTEEVKVLISEEKIAKRIEEMGRQISEDYAGSSVHLICVLKGSAFFTCELAKRITIPVTIDFMACSSYKGGTSPCGAVEITKDLDEPIRGRNVIVVEDIIDSGRTLSYLLMILGEREPASLTLCTLLDKPSRREVSVDVRYTGFVVENKFVVGYGLDHDQQYRNLPYVGYIET